MMKHSGILLALCCMLAFNTAPCKAAHNVGNSAQGDTGGAFYTGKYRNLFNVSSV